ncbi:MAG: HPr-rel-A system PqqD family peptide chaperone [Rhizobium sp.]|nr:HPr-rel-A system PqqD family peptide chaperone [Rhizobium sp.]
MARFQIKSFEKEAVVFDTASGDTHHLAPFNVALFQLVQDNPGMSLDELHGALASRLSLEPGPDLVHQTDQALASLRRIGLLETP